MLHPFLTNRLATVPKNKSALADFFVQWLGPSEDEALKRSGDTALWPSSPSTNRGDVFAYQLKNEGGFQEDLMIDFRNPEKIRIGIATGYNPPPKKSPHDEISEIEKRIATELNATEINLGGGSQDGSAKTGFWVILEGVHANEENIRKAAKLTTLVTLNLTGRTVTDASLSPLKGHSYLASLKLHSTSVSDAGLAHLSGLKALKFLTVEDSNATEQGVKALQLALPKCEIEFGEK
jgi:hypothetical protein